MEEFRAIVASIRNVDRAAFSFVVGAPPENVGLENFVEQYGAPVIVVDPGLDQATEALLGASVSRIEAAIREFHRDIRRVSGEK